MARTPDNMSKKDFVGNAVLHSPRVREVKIEVTKTRRHTHGPITVLQTVDGRVAKVSSRSNDYVYVNSGYVGSVNSVAGDNVNRLPVPPTSVIREQYWACAKWPFSQKVLALAVGILLGAVIALSISFALKNVNPDDVIGGIFRTNTAME